MDHEPGSNWWVLYTLTKHDALVALVKKHSVKYIKGTHEFGVKCPKTVEDVLELKKQNGNTMWADAITKEMKNVHVTFNHLETQPPNGCQFVK